MNRGLREQNNVTFTDSEKAKCSLALRFMLSEWLSCLLVVQYFLVSITRAKTFFTLQKVQAKSRVDFTSLHLLGNYNTSALITQKDVCVSGSGVTYKAYECQQSAPGISDQ